MLLNNQQPIETITARSNRDWLKRHQAMVWRYLIDFHDYHDYETVFNLLYWAFPDEGRKLIENFELSDEEKKRMFIEFIYYSSQLTCLFFADERMGKDATLCRLYDDVALWCKDTGNPLPIVMTLGNVKNPPFVSEEHMIFSFRDILSASGNQQIWVYCSELDVMLPSRDPLAPENRNFTLLSGTFAQNHVKLFGCVKLASKVDLNAIRGCNAKVFKYINPEKLQIQNVERANVLTPLGEWLLPRDRDNKKETLLVFDNQLFSVNYDLPEWWTQEYSEQFNNIPEKKIWDYIDAVCLDQKAPAIYTAIAQKFRNKTITLDQINDHLDKVLGS